MGYNVVKNICILCPNMTDKIESDGRDVFSETLVSDANQPTANANGSFDMNAIIQSQTQTPAQNVTPTSAGTVDLNKLLDSTPASLDVLEKAPVSIGGKWLIKKILGGVLISAAIVGLYFSATIFYPVEIENLQNLLSWVTSGSTADTLGSDIRDTTIDDQISTPIADSIAQQNVPLSEEFTTDTESQQMRDTILPNENQGVDSNTNLNADVNLELNPRPIDGNNIADIPKSDNTFDNLKNAFGMSEKALDEYIDMLNKIKTQVSLKEKEYLAVENTRWLAIVKTLLNRVNMLIEGLQNEDNEQAIISIEDDIEQINKLIEVLNQ